MDRRHRTDRSATRRSIRLGQAFAGAGIGLVLGAGPAMAQSTEAIDLSSWQQQGLAGQGNWNVQDGGDSVLQTINGGPTYFVSPNNFINATIEGSFEVETGSDDDFIGFVFGYNGPFLPETDARDFYLLDWKQTAQNYGGGFADEGLTLSRVRGNIEASSAFAGSAEEQEYLWGHPDTGPTEDDSGVLFDVLGTDYGDDRGWLENTPYMFQLTYQEDRIEIYLGGGQFGEGERIFDLTADEAGVDAFAPGRFGFYNYSQEQVRYAGFTRQDAPVDPDPDPNPTVVPSPAALPAGLLLLGAGLLRRRRA